MSDHSALRTPQAVTDELDISPATLRRWSDEFADYLSAETNSGDGQNPRGYTGADVETLQTIKELMNSGMTYEQVRQKLVLWYTASPKPAGSNDVIGDDSAMGDLEPAPESDNPKQIGSEKETALVAFNGNESPAIAFLTHTLTTLSDTQQSILNSQAANRELLGVLIQDNFNLKEENNRLRQRILEIERSITQGHQEDEWRREALRKELDAKISAAQQLATEAINLANNVETPEIKAIKSKPGCLGALFGGGETQIIALPRRRKREGKEGRPGGDSALPTPTPIPPPRYGTPPTQPTSAYPKPTLPPE